MLGACTPCELLSELVKGWRSVHGALLEHTACLRDICSRVRETSELLQRKCTVEQ